MEARCCHLRKISSALNVSSSTLPLRVIDEMNDRKVALSMLRAPFVGASRRRPRMKAETDKTGIST